MTVLTISSRGQVTLKRAVLDALGVRPGDKVEVEPTGNRTVVIQPLHRGAKVADSFGALSGYAPAKPVTIDEMNAIIAEGWAGAL